MDGTSGTSPHARPWVIVLAGGQGGRAHSTAERRTGAPPTHPFCTIIGSRTVLQHTLDRAAAITSTDRIVVVVGKEHRARLDRAMCPGSAGVVIEQPFDRGTAFSVFLALACVLERDPDATVLCLPANQFASPNDRFLGSITRACEMAAATPNRLLLVAAPATHADTDYDWIIPERDGVSDAAAEADPLPVAFIREKPNAPGATTLFRNDSYLNTMVFAVRASTLWGHGCFLAPGLMDTFVTVRDLMRATRTGYITTEDFAASLRCLYSPAPTVDFTAAILRLMSRHTLIVPLDRDVVWSDWDRPEHVTETLNRIGAGRTPEVAQAMMASADAARPAPRVSLLAMTLPPLL